MKRWKLLDRFTVDRLLREAAGCNGAANDLLLMAAEYIREGEPLPDNLRAYISEALEGAISNPEKYDPYNANTGEALLIGLNLKRVNRPTAGIDPFAVCAFMYEQMRGAANQPKTVIVVCDGKQVDVGQGSQSKAAREAAEHFGISESTAKRYFREFAAEYIQSLTAEADPPTEDEIDLLNEMQEQLARL